MNYVWYSLAVFLFVAFVVAYPWIMFWAIGVLFPTVNITYGLWEVIAFYTIVSLFLPKVATVYIK